METEKICEHRECNNPLPPGKKKYCSRFCKKSTQNWRDRNKPLNGVNLENQLNDTVMDESTHSEDDLEVQILNPTAGMPVPKDHASVQWAMYDLKNRLDMAVNLVRSLKDKNETSQEKIQEKQREIDDLKRSIERMEDANNSKSGIGEMLDGFRDEGGQIDLAGLGQLIKGAGEGLRAAIGKGAAVPPQLTGIDGEMPPEIKEYVTHFAKWFGNIDPKQREMSWSIINAMSTSPEIGLQFLKIIQNGASTRSQATN